MATEKLKIQKLTDHDWLRQVFMISHGTQSSESGEPSQEDKNIRARFFSTAEFKFADTRLGGNMVINPLPQFTRNADPKVKGLYASSEGMGRYYSEAIDDNKRIITMCFGVPSFNSLSTFYSGFYDNNAATVARTGRSPSIFYQAGRLIGFVAGFLSPWLVLYSLGSAFIRIAMGQSSSKYYFFKSTMPTYWNAVQQMSNDIAVKTQLVTRLVADPHASAGDTRTSALPESELGEINKHIFDLVDSYDDTTGQGNGINVYAVATRYSRIQQKAFKTLELYYASRSLPGDFSADASGESKSLLKVVSDSISDGAVDRPKVPFMQYMENWSSGSSPGAMLAPGNEKINLAIEAAAPGTGTPDANTDANAGGAAAAVPQGTADLLTEKSILAAGEKEQTAWYDFLFAELNDGSQYVSFRVENTGDASESFTNQVGEPEILSKINSISGAARSTRFTAAEGNIVGGLAGKLVGGVVGAVKDLATGAADSLGIGGIAALGGNAFADIPKHWLQSTSSLPRMNYRIKLISPYGNRYSKFVNLWLPLTMLLVGALPLSAGEIGRAHV